MAQIHWIRSHGFTLALLGAVGMAFAFPAPGAREGCLQPAWLTNGGIALILLLQGLSLAAETIRASAGHWRLHGVIQGFTFGIFPLVGILWYGVMPVLWPSAPTALRDGFLFLCVLPSTVSTSVVLTAVARGNTAGALFNAALSNVLGVFFTPVLVQLLLHATGRAVEFGPLLLNILGLTLLPFFVGMALRQRVKSWVDRHKVWVTRLCNAVVVFIVYTAFCDSVADRVWQRYGGTFTLQVLGAVLALFVLMSALAGLTCRGLQLNRADAIAAYFCAVKKTLALGVPLAVLIFGVTPELPLILLPVMFYHPVQLLVNGWLANRWSGG